MNATRAFLLLSLAAAAAAQAQPVPSTRDYQQASPAHAQPNLQGGRSVPLAAKERRAVAISQQWVQQSDLVTHGAGGRLVYRFGASLPTIVCQPLQVCDLELQPGEQVKPGGVHVGDAVRWSITPAVSGMDGLETTHVILKPKDTGLDTTLMIATDRRTYHLRLRSSARDYMPLVSFSYPEEEAAQWAALYGRAQQDAARQRLPGAPGGSRIEELDFAYRIDGEARWKPVRVYNDGLKTVIEMPASLRQSEAPALLVLDGAGDEQLVNYRLRENRYLVDAVFDKAVLVAGVGRHQTRVSIGRSVRR